MKTKKAVSLIALSLLLFGFANLFSQERQRPNIIFIMSDDHAKNAISAYGSKITETPNIDRIADEGLRFDCAFVTNSICAPSRAVALTGKYSHINGLKDNSDTFDGSQMTFPQLLQNAGYQTALIGKWHLKTTPTGFDTWKVLPGQGAYYNPRFIENGDTVKYTGYATDLITDFAIEQIQKFDKDKPFCLLYWHKAPHRNWMPDAKHLKMFDNETIPVPETFFDDYSTRSDAAKQQDMRVADLYNSFDMKLHLTENDEEYSGGKASFNAKRAWERIYNSMTEEQRKAWDEEYEPVNEEFRKLNLSGSELALWKYQRYIKDYLRCIASLDDNVGRLLDYLDGSGLTENTVVIYTSDQGFFLGEHGWYDKRWMYEESLGTPLIIKYPKSIKYASSSDAMILNLDICPTILDLAGVEIPADVQGKSLLPFLEGNTPGDWRKSIYYHYYQGFSWHKVQRHYGVRTDRYKLIYFYDIDQWELYDLAADPNELKNIYGQEGMEKVTEELKEQLQNLRDNYRVTE